MAGGQRCTRANCRPTIRTAVIKAISRAGIDARAHFAVPWDTPVEAFAQNRFCIPGLPHRSRVAELRALPPQLRRRSRAPRQREDDRPRVHGKGDLPRWRPLRNPITAKVCSTVLDGHRAPCTTEAECPVEPDRRQPTGPKFAYVRQSYVTKSA